MQKISRRSVVMGALVLPLMSTAALAADKILASVPGLSFPFFVHMMNAFKAEIEKQGYEAIEERARFELGMIKQDEVFVQIPEKAGATDDSKVVPASPAPAPPARKPAR